MQLRDSLSDLLKLQSLWNTFEREIVNRAATLDKIVHLIFESLGRDVKSGAISYQDETQQTFMLTWSDAGIQRTIDASLLNYGAMRFALDARQWQHVDDTREAQRQNRAYTFPQGIRSEIAIPLFQDNEVVGVLYVGSTKPHRFGDDEYLWLRNVANIMKMTPFTGQSSQSNSSLSLDVAFDVTAIDTFLTSVLKEIAQSDCYAALIIADEEKHVVPSRAADFYDGIIHLRPPLGDIHTWSSLHEGLIAACLRTSKAQIIPNVHALPPGAYLNQDDRVVAEIVLPVFFTGNSTGVPELVGALDIEARQPILQIDSLAERLQRRLDQISPLAKIWQIREKLAQEEQIFQHLNNVAGSFAQRYSLESIYDQIAQAVLQLLPNAWVCHIMTADWNPKTHKWILTLAHVSERDGEGHTPEEPIVYNEDRGVTGEAVRTQKPVYVRNTTERETDNTYLNFTPNMVADLAIPLILGKTVIGVLNIESKMIDAFTPRERLVAELLAMSVMFAIADKRDEARNATLLQTVIDASRSVFATVERPQILYRTILEAAQRVTNTTDGYCALILYDPDRQILRKVAHVGEELPNVLESWPYLEGVTGEAMAANDVVYVPDVSLRKGTSYVALTPNTRSNLVVPLRNDLNKPIGILNLESPIEFAFDAHSIAALQSFVPPLVAALVKSQVLEQLRVRNGETIEVLEQLVHQLRDPVLRAQEALEIRDTIVLAGERDTIIAGAVRYFSLLTRWLEAKALVLRLAFDAEREDKPLPAAKRQLVDVRGLIQDVMNAYSFYSQRKHIALKSGSSSEPLHFMINQFETLGALFELLSNAVKYSENGTTVTITADQIGNQLWIMIDDEGPGVPEALRESIFLRGFRGPTSKAVPGTGLGLFFVRQAIEIRQGGDVPPPIDNPHSAHGSRFIMKFHEDPE